MAVWCSEALGRAGTGSALFIRSVELWCRELEHLEGGTGTSATGTIPHGRDLVREMSEKGLELQILKPSLIQCFAATCLRRLGN